MADRSIILRLGANVAGLVSGLRTAEQATRDFATRSSAYLAKHEQSINTVANSAALMGAAMVGVAGFAIKTSADFEQAMSNIKATGGEAASSLGSLRDAALQAGRDTAYSAKEAAGGIEELLKAGVSAKDVLGGGLSGALNLAASGQLAVGDAAELAATAMTQFKLKGDQVNHVADLLAAGASKAQGGVSDLGMALKQSGLVAASTGLSIEETTAGLTAFASAGLIGSDAGTSFKSMLQRLTPQSAEAQAKMDELGISAYDAQGNFIGLAELAGNLQGALKDLTPQQRNAAEATIFGSDAVRAANVLYDEGEKGIRDWISAVDDQGFAAETAATRLDNLNGDLKILQGSFDTMMIGLGESAQGPLRSVVQQITEVVNGFSKAPPAVQTATLAIVGGGGLVLLGMAGMAKLAISINNTALALKEMGVISAATSTRMAGIGAAVGKIAGYAVAVGALAAATGLLIDKFSSDVAVQGANELARSIGSVVDSGGDLSQLDEAFQHTGKFVGLTRVEADSLKETFDKLLHQDITDQVASWGGAFPGVTSYMEIMEGRVGSLDEALSSMVQQGDIDKVTEFQSALSMAGYTTEEINQLLPLTKDALIGAADAQAQAATATDTTTGAISEQVDALQTLIDKQAEAAGLVLSVRDAQRQFEASLDDAAASIAAQVDELARQYEAEGMAADAAHARAQAEVDASDKLDISTEAGRRNQDALDAIADSGWKLIDSLKASGASSDDLSASMQTTRDNFILAAEQMGLTEDQARDLANQLGLIPTSISTTAHADTADAMASASDLKAKYDNFPREITTTFKTLGDGSFRTEAGGILRAGGGEVTGPGTRTSDSIPARLSNGEHVWTADEVDAVGGQSAMYRLRTMARSGQMKFAGGGAVYAQRQYASPSSSGHVSSGPSINVTVTADSAMAQDFAREVARASTNRLQDTLAAHGISAILTGV